MPETDFPFLTSHIYFSKSKYHGQASPVFDLKQNLLDFLILSRYTKNAGFTDTRYLIYKGAIFMQKTLLI